LSAVAQIEALLSPAVQAWQQREAPGLVDAFEPLEALQPPSERRWCRA